MTVRAPLADIEQVALNLIQNAISAMKQSGGTLEVRTLATTMPRSGTSTASPAEPVPVVQLAVSDTGVGIQKEHLSKIFEPFFTTKPVGEGRGFGLSVVARIAHSLGGWVSVNSVVDEGSRFDLYLPAIDPPAAQTTEVPRVTAKSMRILLVEDDERLAQLSERVLRQDGHDVRVFTSSPSALEAFHKAPKDFDLVITDNTMPEMTGLELAERIAQIRPSLPILLVSGITDTLSMDELHRRGIRHALSKPYSAEELRAVLGSLTQ
jgi:CheY-like chemotaxis protein